MATPRGRRSLDGILWLVRVLAGVAGVAAGAQAYASGLAPLVGTLAALGAFGLAYALLLGGVRRYGRLLERASDDDSPQPPVAPEASPSSPPHLIRTRRREGPRRRLMSPEDPPREP
jgi:hypothetical protein